MTIKDSDYIDNVEISDFLYHLRNCEPTHYGSDSEEIAEAFRDRSFIYYSSSEWPEILVIDICIKYVQKLASYKSNHNVTTDEVFFVSMPIAILSKTTESKDRTLVWANGMVTLTEDGELILFLDKDLAEKLERYAK